MGVNYLGVKDGFLGRARAPTREGINVRLSGGKLGYHVYSDGTRKEISLVKLVRSD